MGGRGLGGHSKATMLPDVREDQDMPTGLRERIGMWLQRFTWLDAVVLRYDGVAPSGRRRYVNRVSRHVIVR